MVLLRRNQPARNPREGVLQYIKKERKGKCIPWTKSTWTAGLGPVQVNIRWTKQGIPWTR